MDKLNDIHINPFSLIFGVFVVAMFGVLAWLMLHIAASTAFPRWKTQIRHLIDKDAIPAEDARRLLGKAQAPIHTLFRFLAALQLILAALLFVTMGMGLMVAIFNPPAATFIAKAFSGLLYLIYVLPIFGGLWLILCGGAIHAANRIAQLADPKSLEIDDEDSFVRSLKRKSAMEIRVTGLFLLIIGGVWTFTHMPAEAWPYLHKALTYLGLEGLWFANLWGA